MTVKRVILLPRIMSSMVLVFWTFLPASYDKQTDLNRQLKEIERCDVSENIFRTKIFRHEILVLNAIAFDNYFPR